MKAKIAVITGAASGIGFALAKACIQRDMHLVMIDNASHVLDEAAHTLKSMSTSSIYPIVCDVTCLDEVVYAVNCIYDEFNQVDLLINNAGISGALLPLWDISIDRIRKLMDVNLYGILHGIHAFLPRMFQQKTRSHIVNMASVYGLCSGSLVGDYAMSKHAIVALSESLYFDLQRQNKPVDVSVVCPSFVNTPLLIHSSLTTKDPVHLKMQSLFERSRTPEDIAEHILREISNNQFYIFPDKEIKNYCTQRLQGIEDQSAPTAHGLEKIMSWIMKS